MTALTDTHSHSGAHGHGHDHPPHLAHHWDNPKQQFEAGKLGMWLFLATEVLLFGGLFCAYAVWRGNHPELFRYGSTFLDTKWGAINTAVLIVSSLTMAWGVTFAQQGKRGPLLICLFLTLAGAAGFLGIKYVEYSHKFHEGYFPGAGFYNRPAHSHSFERDLRLLTPTAPVPLAVEEDAAIDSGLPAADAPTIKPAAIGPAGLKPGALDAPHASEPRHVHHGDPTHPLLDHNRPINAHKFFDIYFMMTGLHGIHVLVGMIVIVWLIIKTMRGHFSADYWTPIDLGGLYWHIVDLIWIFLFPLFYLI